MTQYGVSVDENQSQGNKQKEFGVFVLEQAVPKLTCHAQLVAFIGQARHEPTGRVHVRSNHSTGEYLAEFWVVILEQQSHETKATLEAYKVIVDVEGWDHVLDEEDKTVVAHTEWVASQKLR